MRKEGKKGRKTQLKGEEEKRKEGEAKAVEN